jgi:hypothetical protein
MAIMGLELGWALCIEVFVTIWLIAALPYGRSPIATDLRIAAKQDRWDGLFP